MCMCMCTCIHECVLPEHHHTIEKLDNLGVRLCVYMSVVCARMYACQCIQYMCVCAILVSERASTILLATRT